MPNPSPKTPPIYAYETKPSAINFVKMVGKRLLSSLGLSVRRQISPGFSLFGYSLFRHNRPGKPRHRSLYAQDYALSLKPKTVLDVGSGGGYHALVFANAGSSVLCVDFGTSIYAQESTIDNLNVVHMDFNEFLPPQKYDLVWASHVLEHQRNVGLFLEKLIDCCSEDGDVCITVPNAHRTLWGGHLTLWTPGLLAYNIVMCGVDLSQSKLVQGTDEFSIFFKPRRVQLPALTFDNGDLTLLSNVLPKTCYENGDPWVQW